MFQNIVNAVKEKTKVLENAVMNYEDEEIWVREATSAQLSLAPTSLMIKIADATHRMNKCALIMNAIWERLRDVSSVKHVYKSLNLIEYLVKNGNERVVVECRRRIMDIRQFTRYTIRNLKNQEVGGEVRAKAAALVELLHDKKHLKAERRKAKSNRGKYTESVSHEDTRFRSYDNRRNGGRQKNIEQWNYDSSESSDVDEKGNTDFHFEHQETPENEFEDFGFNDDDDPFDGFEFNQPPTSSQSLVAGGGLFDSTPQTTPQTTPNTGNATNNPFDFLTAPPSSTPTTQVAPDTNTAPTNVDFFGNPVGGSTSQSPVLGSGSASPKTPVDSKDPWAKSHLFNLDGISKPATKTGPTLGQTITPNGQTNVQFNFSGQSTNNSGLFTSQTFGFTNTQQSTTPQTNNNNNTFGFI